MKRHVSAIIAVLLTASLFAAGCGGSSSQDAGSGGSASAQTATTEASETEGVQQSPETETPGTAVPEDASAAEAETEDNYTLQMVEITPDNWQDYFEIVFAESPALYILSSDVPNDNMDYYEYEFQLKEEYAKGFLEHDTYTLPEGSGLPLEAAQLLILSGDTGMENPPDVTFTYRVSASEDVFGFLGLSNISYVPGGYLEAESGLAQGAVLRYLMASNGMFEESYNDFFLSCFTPLTSQLTSFSKGKDDPGYDKYSVDREQIEQWLSENIEIEITDIHGTVPVWVKE